MNNQSHKYSYQNMFAGGGSMALIHFLHKIEIATNSLLASSRNKLLVISNLHFRMPLIWFLLIFLNCSDANAQAALRFDYSSGHFTKDFARYLGRYGLKKKINATTGQKLRKIINGVCGATPKVWNLALQVSFSENGITKISFSDNTAAGKATVVSFADAITRDPDDILNSVVRQPVTLSIPPCLPVPKIVLAPADRTVDIQSEKPTLSSHLICGKPSYDESSSSNCNDFIIQFQNFDVAGTGESKTDSKVSNDENGRLAAADFFRFYGLSQEGYNGKLNEENHQNLEKKTLKTYNSLLQRNADPKLAAIALSLKLQSAEVDRRLSTKIGKKLLKSSKLKTALSEPDIDQILSSGQIGFKNQWSEYKLNVAKYADVLKDPSNQIAMLANAADKIKFEFHKPLLQSEPAYFPNSEYRVSSASRNQIDMAMKFFSNHKSLSSFGTFEIIPKPAVQVQKLHFPLDDKFKKRGDVPQWPKDIITNNQIVDSSEDKNIAKLVLSALPVFDAVLEPGSNSYSTCGKKPDATEFSQWADELGMTLLRNRAAYIRHAHPRSGDEVRIFVPDTGLIPVVLNGLNLDTFLMRNWNQNSMMPQCLSLSSNKIAHGTSVAGLTMGGPNLIHLAPAFGIKMRFQSLPLFLPKDINICRKFSVSAEDMIDATGDVNGTYHIVNLSFGSNHPSHRQQFQSGITNSKNALFVVAAGNNMLGKAQGGIDLSDSVIMPAGLGGGPIRNVVTIAATTWNRKRAPFSNFGREVVDLGYFGCNVDTHFPMPKGIRPVKARNGTSFAAPFVSYVGALIRSLMSNHKHKNGPVLKARLLAGTDVESSLFNDIADGRLLNPLKAVAIYEDVIELKSPAQVRSQFGNSDDSNHMKFVERHAKLCQAGGSRQRLGGGNTPKKCRLLYGQIATPKEVFGSNPRSAEFYCSGKSSNTSDLMKVARLNDSQLVLYSLTKPTRGARDREFRRILCTTDRVKADSIQIRILGVNASKRIGIPLGLIRDITFSAPRDR